MGKNLPKQPKHVDDIDMLSTFLHFHLSKTRSPRLKIEPEMALRSMTVPKENNKNEFETVKVPKPTGNLLLYYNEFYNTPPDLFCRISKLNGEHILQLNPRLGDQRLISSIFGSFPNKNIYDFKLKPLTAERSLILHGERDIAPAV